MYLPLIFLNTIATAFYLVLSSKLMKQKGLSPNLTIALVHLGAAAVLFILMIFTENALLPVFRSIALTWLIVASVLKLLSKEMHFYAYAKTEVANVTVFSAFIPIFGMFFGVMMLNEKLNQLEIGGTLIVCLSIYFLFLTRHKDYPGAKSLIYPFIAMRTFPIFMAFLSTLPPALSAVYMKRSALIINHLPFAFFSTLLIGSAAALIELGRTRVQKTKIEWKNVSIKDVMLIGVIFAAAQYSFVVLLTMEDISHTIALQPLGILFQMVLAYFLIGERQKPYKRILFGGCIIFGSILLELGR